MEKKRKAVYNPEADKRWIEQNKEHRKYLSTRSRARCFIRSMAKAEDIEELEKLIEQRKIQLKEL